MQNCHLNCLNTVKTSFTPIKFQEMWVYCLFYRSTICLACPITNIFQNINGGEPQSTQSDIIKLGPGGEVGYSRVKRIGMTVGNPKKIPSHKNMRTLKHTFWSKINLKNAHKLEFIKETYSKELYHYNSTFLYPKKYRFYYFNRFRF